VRADNSLHLLEAARRRSEQTWARAVEALDGLACSGEAITVATVSAAAGVSRSWLYTQPELVERIAGVGAKGRPSKHGAVPPVDQRASTASLRGRLELAHQKVARLTAENRQLRDELERAYGQIRSRNTGV
jgi:hypothetical protein